MVTVKRLFPFSFFKIWAQEPKGSRRSIQRLRLSKAHLLLDSISISRSSSVILRTRYEVLVTIFRFRLHRIKFWPQRRQSQEECRKHCQSNLPHSLLNSLPLLHESKQLPPCHHGWSQLQQPHLERLCQLPDSQPYPRPQEVVFSPQRLSFVRHYQTFENSSREIKE